jgi:hypothetical protein
MKRPTRSDDGKYHIKGKIYPELFGSRIQVFRGNAYKTTGGLTASKFIKNKHGRIVSAIKHKTAKINQPLLKAGYDAEKGNFGYIKTASKTAKNRRNSSKKRK